MLTQKRKNSTAVLTVLSALAAIGIVLGKFLAFNITEFMRFSLENLTILLSGIVFGPIYGLAVGIVQDLVGCLMVGYTINPIITLGSAVIGTVCGLVYKHTKMLSQIPRISISVAIAHLLGSVMVKSIGLAVFYELPFLATVAWRSLNYVIVGVIEIILLVLMLKSKLLLTQINKIAVFSADKGGSDNDA